MIRSLFTRTRPVKEIYIAVAAVLLLLTTGIGLAQDLHWGMANPFNQNSINQAAQPVNSGKVVDTSSLDGQLPGGIQPADAYSVRLAFLEQWALEVSRFGEASSYAVQLGNLEQRGRTAFTASKLPVSANSYASYLESLRRLGQAAYGKQVSPVGSNSFVTRLDDLRRMGAEAMTGGKGQ